MNISYSEYQQIQKLHDDARHQSTVWMDKQRENAEKEAEEQKQEAIRRICEENER